MLGCRLSRFVCSLSSAGNVCWAKPNHAFFNCQQLDDVFLRARALMLCHACPYTQCDYAPTIASCTHAAIRNDGRRKHWRGSQRCMHACAEYRMRFSTRRAATRVHALRMHRTFCIGAEATMRLRVAQVGLRENCANFFRRAMRFASDSAFDRACVHCRKNHPRRCRRGWFRYRRRLLPSISGRRLPAIRRTRQGRAGR